MQRMKNYIRLGWDRTESLVTDRRVSYVLLLVTMFWAFFCFDLFSVGLECLLIAGVLWLFHFRSNRQMWLASVSAFFCAGALMMLLLSGRMGERGFNAPIGHALKFIYLFFVQVVSLLLFRLDKKQRRNVLLFGLGVILFSMAVSLFYVIFVDKYAIRYFQEEGFHQVVDFNQMYAIPFVITAAACWLLSKVKHPRQLLAYIPLLVLTIGCVCLSLFTTALLLMVMGLFLAFLFSQYYRSPKRFWVIMGVLVVAVVLCFVFRQQVSDLVYALTEHMNWLVKARIRSVVDMILGTSQENWYAPDRRNELAGYSIDSFLNHPIFGVGYTGYAYGVIGCHHEWYDLLGVFGVFGTVLFLLVMGLLCLMTYLSARTPVDKASFLICLFLFVVLGFLNPVLNLPVLIAVFMIAPNISVLPLKSGWVRRRMMRVRKRMGVLFERGEKK